MPGTKVAVRSIQILIAEVRPVGPETLGDLGVPPRRIEHTASLGRMADDQCFVQPLENLGRMNIGVGCQDGLAGRAPERLVLVRHGRAEKPHL